MKKLFIALGLFALFGTVMVGVSASAQRYHRYRNSYNAQRYGMKTRTTSYRLRENERRITRSSLKSTSSRGSVRTGQTTKNIKRIWRGKKYFRPELYRDYPENANQRGASVVAQENLLPSSEFTFDEQAGFAQDGAGIFRTSKTSLAFRVYNVDDDFICQKENFSRCVQRVMDGYRRRMGVSKVHLQDYSFRQTINDDFSYQLTYREAFVGRDRNIYFVMGLINPNSGKMVRVEAVALPRHEREATQYAHQLFESFRFINTGESDYNPSQGSNTNYNYNQNVNQNLNQNAVNQNYVNYGPNYQGYSTTQNTVNYGNQYGNYNQNYNYNNTGNYNYNYNQ